MRKTSTYHDRFLNRIRGLLFRDRTASLNRSRFYFLLKNHVRCGSLGPRVELWQNWRGDSSDSGIKKYYSAYIVADLTSYYLTFIYQSPLDDRLPASSAFDLCRFHCSSGIHRSSMPPALLVRFSITLDSEDDKEQN